MVATHSHRPCAPSHCTNRSLKNSNGCIRRVRICRAQEDDSNMHAVSLVTIGTLSTAGASNAQGLDIGAVAASQAALQGVFQSAAEALSADAEAVQGAANLAAETLAADASAVQAAFSAAAETLQADAQNARQQLIGMQQGAVQAFSAIDVSKLREVVQNSSEAVEQLTRTISERSSNMVQQLPTVSAGLTSQIAEVVSRVEGQASVAYSAAQVEALQLSDNVRQSLARLAASLQAASSSGLAEAEQLAQRLSTQVTGQADSMQHAVQAASHRAIEVVREQPEAVTGAAVLAAMGGTLALVAAQQQTRTPHAAALKYERQLADIKAQAMRAKETAAVLQSERDAAQLALENERAALLLLQQDAAVATQQLKMQLEQAATVAQARQAQGVLELQQALELQRAQTYAAECKAQDLQAAMDADQAKFVVFHGQAMKALELLQLEQERSGKLKAANQELQVLLQQAALLQKQQEELLLQQQQSTTTSSEANETYLQLQSQVAELAEVNEKLRVELERAMLERIAAGPDSEGAPSRMASSLASSSDALLVDFEQLRSELEAERMVANTAGAQAVQAKRSLEVVMASSAELMQKLEASQQREQGLEQALIDMDSKVHAAQQDAQKQRDRNAALIKQVDANAEQAMLAIKMLQQESQNIIAGQAAVIECLTKERDVALAKLAEAEAKLDAERGAVQSLKAEVRAAKEALLTSFNDITTLQSELGVARESTSVIKGQVDDLTDQINIAEQELSEQVALHLIAMQAVLRLRAEADGLRTELEQTAQELMKQDMISPELQQHVYLLREAYAVTVDRLEYEQSVGFRVKHEVERLKKQLQQLQERSGVLRAELDVKEQVLTKVMLEASRQLGATEGRLRQAEERLGRSNRQLAAAQGQLEEVGLEAEQGSPALRKQAAAVVAKLQGVINGVRQEMTVLQQETVRAQAELTSERQARLAAEQQLQANTAEYLEGLKNEQRHRQTLEHRLRSLQHEYWAVKATLTAPQMQDAAQLMAATMPKKVRVSERVLQSKQNNLLAAADALLTPGPEDDMVQALA